MAVDPYLSSEQESKLQHAVERGAKHIFCGDETDPDLLKLVNLGFMRGPIRAGFLPEGEAYFQATRSGLNYPFKT